MNKQELVTCLDKYLQISAIIDYGPQRLQVEASNHDVQRID